MQHLLAYLWKVPLAALVFNLFLLSSSLLLQSIGMSAPEMPAGADPEQVGLVFMIATILPALAQLLLARGLQGWRATRWWIFTFLFWVGYGVNTVVEGAVFSSISAVSSFSNGIYTLLNLLLPSMALAGSVVFLVKPRGWPPLIDERFRKMQARHRSWSHIARIVIALAAFPAIYIAMGLVVEPWVSDYYASGAFSLRLPGMNIVVGVQFLRSLLFLVVSLPVIVMWGSSRASLIWRLGFALFVFAGAFPMATAYWMSWEMRLIHTIEIFVDMVLYAGVLTLLFASHDR